MRVHVVARAIAKRSGEFRREGRRWKGGKPDDEGRNEDEAVASLVCLGDEAAAGRVATMAGWMTRTISDTSDRSEGTMDCSIDGE